MCIVQNEAPLSVNERDVPRSDARDQLQKPIHFFCEALIVLLSGAAFSIALFLLMYGLSHSQACLPLGCVAKVTFPMLYVLTLIVFAIVVTLMAYVLVSTICTITRSRRDRDYDSYR